MWQGPPRAQRLSWSSRHQDRSPKRSDERRLSSSGGERRSLSTSEEEGARETYERKVHVKRTRGTQERAHFLNLIEDTSSIEACGRDKESQEQGSTGDSSEPITRSRRLRIPASQNFSGAVFFVSCPSSPFAPRHLASCHQRIAALRVVRHSELPRRVLPRASGLCWWLPRVVLGVGALWTKVSYIFLPRGVASRPRGVSAPRVSRRVS